MRTNLDKAVTKIKCALGPADPQHKRVFLKAAIDLIEEYQSRERNVIDKRS